MKKIVTIFLLFVSVLQLAGQDLTEKIRSEYSSYREKLSSTKAWLAVPQDKYSPTDTIFFSASFLTEDGHYVSGYQLLRIALVNDQGISVHRQLIEVNDGAGSNQVILPAGLRPGNYLLVAYNDYMKLADTRFFFRTPIQIVGKNALVTEAPKTAVIYSEGGHFIEGVSNRVAVVAPWAKTKSIVVRSTSGTTVAQSELDSYGTASILVKPEKNQQYVAVIDNIYFNFPAVEGSGAALQLAPNSTREVLSLQLSVAGNEPWRDMPVNFVVATNGQLAYTAASRLNQSGTTVVRLPNVNLPPGLAELTVVAGDGHVLATRLFYAQGSLFNCNLDLIPSADGQIRADVTLTDNAGTPIEARVAVSALNASVIPRSNGYELSQNLNIPTLPSNTEDRGWHRALDNYLVVEGGLMPWAQILSDTEPTAKAPPKFVSVRGKAYFKESGKAIPDSATIVGYMKNNRFSFESKAGINGELDLAFLTLDGKDEMFYFAESNGTVLDNVVIRWVYDSLPFKALPSVLTVSPEAYGTFASRKYAIDQSFNYFSSLEKRMPVERFDSNLEGDFRNTGTTVNVQDYRLFPTMPELLREIVPRLYHRKQGNKDIVRVRFNDAVIQPESSPLYVIDGVLTKNTATFLDLDPAGILTIKVIFDPKELSRFHAIGKNGIVIVKTKKKQEHCRTHDSAARWREPPYTIHEPGSEGHRLSTTSRLSFHHLLEPRCPN